VKKVFFILCILIFFSSCREGVVEPGNFVGNINDPVQINDRNSYTFIINARAFSMNLSVPTSFNTSTSRISVTIAGYESGSVNVSIKDEQQTERFKYFINEDVTLYTYLLNGYVPETINISTEDFTGKLKILINRVQ
jgi:hypothetical protein